MGRLIFLTHPEVVIDPAIPVPAWPLSQLGRARMTRFAEMLTGEVAAIWCSGERKARDGAEILSGRWRAPIEIDPALGENDRSATGYIGPPEFWEVVAQFFERPHESIRGWETARNAQTRIVAAIDRVLDKAPGGDVVVVSHGGVGRLLMAHWQGVGIGDEARPGHPGGGCWFTLDRDPPALAGGWRTIEDLT